MSRSSAPPQNAQFPQDDQFGRLYRVDSQMFEMDDEFVELSADVDGDNLHPDQVGYRKWDRKHFIVFKLFFPTDRVGGIRWEREPITRAVQ